MTDPRDGMHHMPDFGPPRPVVEPGEFVFAASHFDHGHVHAQVQGLVDAGGVLTHIYEPDADRAAEMLRRHPGAVAVDDFRRILDDPTVQLVTSAAIPDQRCAIGLEVLEAGKDYFTDKCPFTTLDQLAQARAATAATRRKYMVSYSERLGNEAAWHAGTLIDDGAIGDVVQVLILAPHNLNAPARPDWFFEKQRYGGIITDIGSHQFECFLSYGAAADGTITMARADNLAHPHFPELEDFGEASMVLDNGVSCYMRVDWFNPAGLRSWGDGRTFILGTTGTIELRKNLDIANDLGGSALYLVDGEGEHRLDCRGKVGFPFFGQLILDVLNRTDHAMTQEHAFKAAELSMEAQAMADQARG